MIEKDDDYLKYRAALVSVGALYEDYEGPMTNEMIEIANRIIKERQDIISRTDR